MCGYCELWPARSSLLPGSSGTDLEGRRELARNVAMSISIAKRRRKGTKEGGRKERGRKEVANIVLSISIAKAERKERKKKKGVGIFCFVHIYCKREE